MIICSIRCNNPHFRTLHFNQGFNIVLADKTNFSTKKDSRNGLGKSLLIEIIHFCLGASKKNNRLFNKDVFHHIKDWCFFLDLEIDGQFMSVCREIANPKIITVTTNHKNKEFNESEWSEFLGKKIFGLSNKINEYSPTFRNLISYFIRREDFSFTHPFEYFSKQPEWSKQVHNAFLLGLGENYAIEWQEIKDKKKLISQLKTAARSGIIKGMLGSIGELESEKIRLQSDIEKNRQQLDSFLVHPQYKEIEQHANILTQEIHKLSNDNMSDRQLLDLYKHTVNSEIEQEPSVESIEQLYKEATVVLSKPVTKQLAELQQFHFQLIENRKKFLSDEIKTITENIQNREQDIIKKTSKRAELLIILKTHGALDEHILLEEQHTEKISQLKEVSQRIDNLKQFEISNRELLIEQEKLASKARRDYDERDSQKKQAITLFNVNSQALYEVPGSLIIDIDDKSGYRFNVDIKRTGSTGIEKMKVFCYDLMLIQRWQQQICSPKVLIHDSPLFDGVDERQIELALKLAIAKSKTDKFQYICTLNTDQIPDDLSEALNEYCVLRLKDDKPENSLLGIRF